MQWPENRNETPKCDMYSAIAGDIEIVKGPRMGVGSVVVGSAFGAS